MPSPIHSLRGIPGALLASLTQRGNLPDLLRHCVLQASLAARQATRSASAASSCGR
ncbi:hypothetical protein CSC36_1271 [Pseudomonas aeruginosa]|nr:hypothetical protein CSC36_1271 [Pseudomonas aeruginosa]